jgi:hypothetical protein
MAWHARSQGFESPQLHSLKSAGQNALPLKPMNAAVMSAPVGGWLEDNSQHGGQALGDGRDHAGLHFRGRVPVGDPHRAAALAVSTTLVAHQLVDHPAWDAAVFQPRRVGVPQVVRPSQVQVGEGSVRDRRLVHPAVVPGR